MKRLYTMCIAMIFANTLFAQGLPSAAKAKGGELIDTRDGNSYKTVTVGNQVWMAEDLKFDKGEYTWEVAQDVCPGGWHLPSDEEFQYAIEKTSGGAKVALQSLSKDVKRKSGKINVRCVRDFLLVSQYGRRVGE